MERYSESQQSQQSNDADVGEPSVDPRPERRPANYYANRHRTSQQQKPAETSQSARRPQHDSSAQTAAPASAPQAYAYYPVHHHARAPSSPPFVQQLVQPPYYVGRTYGSFGSYDVPPQPLAMPILQPMAMVAPPPQESMTVAQARPGWPSTDAAVNRPIIPRQTSKPQLATTSIGQRLGRGAKEIRNRRRDTSDRRSGDSLERQVAQVTDRVESLLKSQEDMKRENELLRAAVDAAATQWQQELQRTEQARERDRIEAEIKALSRAQERHRGEREEQAAKERAEKQAALSEERERAVMERLQREHRVEAESKLELEKLRIETQAKAAAELAAQEETINVEATRKQLAAELEAREKMLLEAEIRIKVTAGLIAREKAVLEGEIMNRCTAEGLAREKAMLQNQMKLNAEWELQLDVRERGRAAIDADLKHTDSGGKVRTLTEDSHSTTDTTPFWQQDDNRDHGKQMVLLGKVRETGTETSHGHLIEGQVQDKSTPPAKATEIIQIGIPHKELSRDGASGARAPADVDVVYTKAHARDTAVHLNFELSQDLDDDLEEFSRLARLGDFRSAEAFFARRLNDHFNDPSVFVQYADMLLEKGDFKALMLMDDSSVFARQNRDQPEDSCSEISQLELNWRLVQAIALCHSQHELQPVLDAVRELKSSWRPPRRHVRSTELKNLTLAIRLDKLLAGLPDSDGVDTRQPSDWADWARIYRELVSQDRIWDFRDAFVAVCTSYGTKTALQAFFKHASPIEGLLLDWQTDSHDESTELALLDMLSFMALAATTSPDGEHLAETCLHLAEPLGNSLLDHHPYSIRSRIFIRWVIAKAVAWSDMGKFNYLADYRGHAIFPRFEPGIPYYIPTRKENPGWLPPDVIPTNLQTLKMALETSREIQDYQTEALCLQQLSLRTQDPSSLLQELVRLQKSMQHDMAGYLATCLTKYLVSGVAEAKRELLEEIESFGSWEDPADLVDPTLAAARDVIWRALSPKPADDSERSIEAALKFYPHLSQEFQRIIDNHVPSNLQRGLILSSGVEGEDQSMASGRDSDQNTDSEAEDEARAEDDEVSSESSDESDDSDESGDSNEVVFDYPDHLSIPHRRSSI